MNKHEGPLRVLIIDDDESVRKVVRSRLSRKGFEVFEATTGDEGIAMFDKVKPHVALTDLRMPGLDGFEVLAHLRVPTILMTGHGDKESAIKAIELGAFSFFEKPFDLDQLEVAVQRGAERFLMEREREQLLAELKRLCRLQNRQIEVLDEQTKPGFGFSGSSPKVLEIKSKIARLAQRPVSNVLILGETGTGKEVVARELHEQTHGKKNAPFLALNCAAIPTELLESELYGHEKGSFSGAVNSRIGLAEAVRDGTLFLDEIGEMDPRHQSKLLRLIEARQFRRVGANHEIAFRGRIVAATHRDLMARSKEGLFREDLFYRLSVVMLNLPPLRERGTDMIDIADHLCHRHGVRGIAPERMADMLSYPWPGNIRELGNWIERAAILGLLSTEGFVSAPLPNQESSPGEMHSGSIESAPAALDLASGDIKARRHKVLEHFESVWIKEALARNNGNISAAARSLGLDRKNLATKMSTLGLKVPKSGKKSA